MPASPTLVPIPRTELLVHPINLGANTFGWTSDEAASHAVLDAYAEHGGNFVDTADMYSYWATGNVGGESEAILGRWLRDRGNRDRIVVATKVGGLPSRAGLAPDNIVAALDDSLRRLGTDYVDLYYGHYDEEAVTIEDQVAVFDSLVRTGKVRAVGLSNYAPDRMREWFDVARANGATLPVAMQPRYNLVWRSYEHDYASIARDEGLAVFSWASLAAGFLSGKYRSRADIEGSARARAVGEYLNDQSLTVVEAVIRIAEVHAVEPTTVALAWLLDKGVNPLASASRPEQMTPIMDSLTLSLTREELDRLDGLSTGL